MGKKTRAKLNRVVYKETDSLSAPFSWSARIQKHEEEISMVSAILLLVLFCDGSSDLIAACQLCFTHMAVMVLV